MRAFHKTGSPGRHIQEVHRVNKEKQLRLGVIGTGNMGLGHLDNIAAGLCPHVRVTAVCDIRKEQLEKALQRVPEAVPFDNAEALMDNGLTDAVLIAVPHELHPVYAAEAFQRGLHVLTEKPAGVTVSSVRKMNAAAEASGKKFAIMFNQRTNQLFQRAHELVSSGALGKLKRVVWIVTNWYRTQSYYDSGSWRATWNGEGGGVLLNQAPHNLDLLQWIAGLPCRLHAFIGFGRYHHIAVDDDVTLYGEYENGASLTFITTTGEAPGTNRLEISGDRGKIVIEGGKLKHWQLREAEREFCFEKKEGFYEAPLDYSEYEAPEPDGHPILLEDFALSVLEDRAPRVPGEEGIRSLMLINAAYLSAWTNETVTLPADEARFEALLQERREAESAAGAQVKNPETPGKNAPEDPDALKKRWQVRW